VGRTIRYGLTIGIAALTAFSYAQPLADVAKRLKLLETQPEFIYDASGFSELPKFEYGCDNENQNISDYYHVADLNNDGLMDLIYSGPCAPYYQTAIFINTGRVFRKIYDNPGKIISLEKDESTTVINILKEACCCEFYSQYTQLTINNKSQVAKNTIVFGAKTKITVGSRLKEEKVVGTIRTTPHVNDVIKRDECSDAVVRGNQLKRIHDFSNIIQLNKTGPWWLVLYSESGERSWVGWMKLN
jgi:hypothetical protein